MIGLSNVSYLGRRASAPTIIDGTQGSTNAGILAAVYFTVSGTTPTIVGQKNVSSITRLAAGTYRVTFTSTLSNANYGVLATARRANGSSNIAFIQPSRNSTSGRNSYSTSQVDLFISGGGGSSALDPQNVAVVVFDPASVGSDYLAACCVTVSGTTPTVQTQTNVSSAPRQATGAYRPTFTSTLSNSDYSMFGTTRAADFSNDANLLFGGGRNVSSGRGNRTTSNIDLVGGYLPSSGPFEPARFSMLLRNSDVAPRGTVAAVRFSNIGGGTPVIIRSWNVSSVTRQTTGCYRINFTNQISDTDYMAFGCGTWSDFNQDDGPIVQMNADSGNSRAEFSTTAVDIQTNNTGGIFDCDYVDVWVLKPWLM